MEKIHNNLNIENLIKTDWFNQFNEYQIKAIVFGLKGNLDVSIYAKPEFTLEQMYQIRAGLEDKLDVSKYANSDLTWREMEKIREKLMKEKIKNE